VIIPDQEQLAWKPARLTGSERLYSSGEGDALEAELKYDRVVWAGQDFLGFFKSVKSGDRTGEGDIRNLAR
jgi:hypothetical protein